MSGGRNQRVLLMEIMIAVLFFALCAPLLLQTFTAARESSRRAGVQSAALIEAQSLANRLSTPVDAEALLEKQGFAQEEGIWRRDMQDYDLEVTLQAQMTRAGALHSAWIRAIRADTVLAELEAAYYMPAEVEP